MIILRKDNLRSEHLAKILFHSWRDELEELNIPPCRLFMDVRKKDGGVYEPGSLASL